MKSPRHILLSKHAFIEPRLNAARQQALEVATQGMDQRASGGFVLRLWDELFWSCRRIWWGLAGAWALIALMNVIATGQPSSPTKTAAVSPAKTDVAVTQRQLLRAELFGSATRDAVKATPLLPRPRSDRRPSQMVA